MIDENYHHHGIFSQFPGYKGPVAENEFTDYLGSRFRREWVALGERSPPDASFEAPLPTFDEEYFEWIDLLEVVNASRSRGRFVMIELGAGFGRWGIRGALAARAAKISNIDIRYVEGEPQHAQWLREAVQLNGLNESSTIIEGAIAYGSDRVPFVVEFQEYNSHSWYGQAVGWAEYRETDRLYHGHKVYRDEGEGTFGQIYVPALTLEEVVGSDDVIDFIDIDLQGAERQLIANSIGCLNRQVRRIHIGTHGTDIEEEIRSTMQSERWKPVWDFGTQGVRQTPYGDLKFQDGVQSWINPGLEET